MFHGILTGLAAKCQLAQLERELVRDVFNSNLNVNELQQKFCSKPYSPDRVLSLALAHDRGLADQKSLNSCAMGLALSTLGPKDTKTDASSSDTICAVQHSSDPRDHDKFPQTVEVSLAETVVGLSNLATRCRAQLKQLLVVIAKKRVTLQRYAEVPLKMMLGPTTVQ